MHNGYEWREEEGMMHGEGMRAWREGMDRMGWDGMGRDGIREETHHRHRHPYPRRIVHFLVSSFFLLLSHDARSPSFPHTRSPRITMARHVIPSLLLLSLSLSLCDAQPAPGNPAMPNMNGMPAGEARTHMWMLIYM